MEFTINREIFLEAVQGTVTIAERKTTSNVFNYILLSAEGEELTLSVTDREIHLVSRHNCQVVLPGTTALPARKLYDLVRQSQSDEVHVSVKENNIAHITCGRATFKMFGIPAENYPQVTLQDSQVLFKTVPVDIMKELITGSHYAVATEGPRLSLQGVFFHSLICLPAEDDGSNASDSPGTYLVMVGTDGNRMAITKRAVFDSQLSTGQSGWSFLETGVIIPRRGLMEIKKILDGPPDELELGIEKGSIIIKKGNVSLRVSLIADQFPNYRKVIPDKTDATLSFSKQPVLQAFRRMGVLSSESFCGVAIDLDQGTMTLNSTNPAIGEAKEELEVAYDGPEAHFNFDVNYLIAALEVVEGEEAVFRLNLQGRANVLAAPDNDDYRALIMQLKTS